MSNSSDNIRLMERLDRIEMRLIEQSTIMQRLIAAVERLCERPDASFEKQLSDANRTQPLLSPLPADSGFRPRIVREGEDKPRHRKPLTRI